MSTLLKANMMNGKPYGLVDLATVYTCPSLQVCKTASAHEVCQLGQGLCHRKLKTVLSVKYISNGSYHEEELRTQLPS